MRIILCESYEEMSAKAAEMVAAQVIENPSSVLGFATGSTPVGAYNVLSKMYEDGRLDFSGVVTFNLDEYYPIKKDNSQSYDYFMKENLFSKINVKPENIHIPNGEASDPQSECENYDKCIDEKGGIDLQILGIGQNGHIAFNEPDATLYAGTHVTGLTENTIQANSRFFDSIDEVPTRALTMGIASIMKAKKIIILANGANKREAVARMLDPMIDPMCPASLLKAHRDVTLICDKLAKPD